MRSLPLMVSRTLPTIGLAAGVAALVAVAAQGRDDPPQPVAPAEFARACFDDFYEADGWPDEATLRAVLAEVPGGESRIERTSRHGRPILRLSGRWRLKAPWRPDAALRVSVAEPRDFRMHFRAGRAGVTLRLFPDFRQTWAAYALASHDDKPQPVEAALWATDQGRYRRTGIGTVAVYHHQGQLILARGDVRLLTVPLASPPDEVVFEGSACVRGVTLFDVRGVPDDEPARTGRERVLVPDSMPWQFVPVKDVTLNKLTDGAVELAAAEKTGDAVAWAPVCPAGLHEISFEVENPNPGTGVLLGDKTGKALVRLSFFRDRRTRRTTFGLVRADHREVERSYDANRPMPLAGSRQWFRVVGGAGLARLFTSGDGVNWSQVDPATTELLGPCTQVGLACWASDEARAIRIRRMTVRRLEAIESVVPEPLRQRVAKMANDADPQSPEWLGRAANPEDWEKRVARSTPADVSAAMWRRAWVLQALGAGPTPWWVQQLLEGLLVEAIAETRDPEAGLRLLDEAGLLVNCADWAAADRWAAHYERVGRLVEDQAKSASYPELWRRFAMSPFWAERDLPPALGRLLWHDLLRRMSEDQWESAAELCRSLRFRSRPDQQERQPPPWGGPTEHIVRCVEARAAAHKALLSPDRPTPSEFDYRHPLIEHWAKEGYNVKSEFQAAIEGQGYREACQVVMAASRAAMDGLLPDARDPRLQVSLAGVVDQAMAHSPELRQAMREQFGQVGQMRLQQAIEAGDATAVELVGVQFAGSEAGAEAHRWLGDRHMAAGRFAEAAGEYRRAQRDAPPEQQADLGARLRLAHAMRGRMESGGPSGPITLAGQRLTADQVLGLVEEMASARSASGRSEAEPGPEREGGCPLPGECRVRPFAVIEGEVKRPNHYSAADTDWAGRELAAVVSGSRMVVTSRAEHASLDLATGKPVWRHTRAMPDPARPWPLVSSAPVLGLERVFVRRTADGGPELACLDRVGGALLWTSSGGDYVASDALVVGQGLWALAVRRTEGQKCTLLLVRYDPATGRALARVPLVEFQGFLGSTLPCQATASDDRIVATAGGAVVCCDLSGRLCWVRRQAWVGPPGVAFYDSRPWLLQRHSPPVVDNGHVLVTQPGTWNVECLDLQTGQLIWRTTLSDLVGLVGLAGGRAIAETTDSLVGLDRLSGRVAWRHDASDRLEGRLCGEPGGVLYAQVRASTDAARKESQVALVWVDPRDGRTVDRQVLDLPPRSKPLVGPLVTDGIRLWAFYGVADDTARRELFEVVITRRKAASSGG